MNKKSSKIKKNDTVKDYDRTLDLMKYHAQVVWQVFGTFLITETVILGFIGNAFAKCYELNDESNLFLFCGSIFGLILIIPWLSAFLYTYKQYILRIIQARKHENYTKGIGKLITEGKKLSEKGKVCVDGESLSLSWVSKKLPPKKSYIMIMVFFALAYIVLAILSNPWIKI